MTEILGSNPFNILPRVFAKAAAGEETREGEAARGER
jgi:hypothetical protein